MSPFFGSPAFVAATHDDRVRRLSQLSRPRHGRDRDERHGRADDKRRGRNERKA